MNTKHYSLFDKIYLNRRAAQEQRTEITKLIKQAIKRPSDFGYSGDLDLFNTWALGPVIEHRDSGLLDQSNSAAIQAELEKHPEFNDQWEITHCGHWAVGWVDHLSYKVIENRRAVLHTTVTKIAPVALFIRDLYEQLDDYPILNEDDYSQREYDATYENIKNEASYVARRNAVALPDNYVDMLWVWFDNNNQRAIENTDDQGGYPSEDELTEAFTALGWMK